MSEDDIKSQIDQQNLQQIEEFDWDAYEAGSESNVTKEQELYTDNFKNVNESEVVSGTVNFLTDREAIIGINFKSEGVISLNEFRYNPKLAVGDIVDVLVEKKEDKSGRLILSHRKARTINSWNRVNSAFENEEIVNGHIKCRTKGGMIVDIMGIEAFLPGSQIDVKAIHDYDEYVDKTMEFKIIKINKEFKNIIISHKALIEADIEDQKKEIISNLEKGQVLEGVVKNITSYGLFVDLGGIDGLVHITDISWNRVSHPSEAVELGETLNVVILDFDKEKNRIQLGMKQLQPHPWDTLDENIKEGDKITGEVTVLLDYGAFIQIAKGVEGLMHVSEMSWATHLRSAQDFLKVGDKVEAVILSINREDRKISLGMKQLSPDPWTDITSKYPLDSTHFGKAINFTNFGVFVELESGVDGLVHISDLSWMSKIKHPSDFIKIGDELEVKILELDVENRKLRLGHKQTKDNPWDKYEDTYSVGTIHTLTIDNLIDKGATINLTDEGLKGFVPSRLLVKEDGSKLEKGDSSEFLVIEFSKDFHKVVLSHTDTFKIKEERSSKDYNAKNKQVERSTLGDLKILSELKKKTTELEENAEK
ncbi:30S ribosomal protein S1 [Ichthyobacterium seriolicida]|uniref:Small ribosomal subunit protein bS1 n=1 Tax=Ichthyobacterium seriolicida TaxID=242600 RepID=A0A1J1E4S9_9FLAO|nr:30S ribosomal protein S1 [Ichthyobacterium seriolicida]BAV95060.1 30S ribosomal protein S1 [Ichthyobacterium seriolicida]